MQKYCWIQIEGRLDLTRWNKTQIKNQEKYSKEKLNVLSFEYVFFFALRQKI